VYGPSSIGQYPQIATTHQKASLPRLPSPHDENPAPSHLKSGYNNETVIRNYDECVRQSALLCRLPHFDRSSYKPCNQVGNTLYGEGCKQDLVGLVDNLDEVHRRVCPFAPSSTHHRLQMLLTLPVLLSGSVCTNSDTCGARTILPTSYTLSSQVLDISDQPFSPGVSTDARTGEPSTVRMSVSNVFGYIPAAVRQTR